MKTFTVTFHHSCNYGAILQAYALQQTILEMEIENEIMEYPYKKESISKMLVRPIYMMKYICLSLCRVANRKRIRRREKEFCRFRTEKLRLSRMYHSVEDLKQNPPEVDILITGSDQVYKFWENDEFNSVRFLDFGKADVKKFSYAASIEQLNYTDNQKELVKNWLKTYSGISLREQQAAEYIHSFTGYRTECVLDPVFLLEKEKWMKISKIRKIKEPYILCYQVQSAKQMQRIVDELKKQTGFRTVAVIPYARKWIKADETLFDVSPEEFLALLANAELVVSASFHGVALGMVFDKIVYATAREAYSGRIKNIMLHFGVEHFFIEGTDAIPLPNQYKRESVIRKIQSDRIKSLNFLRENLAIGVNSEKRKY